MASTEPKIDAYIEKSAPFAQPILKHLRQLIHTACPKVEEKIKWGMPHFDYKGEMMCHFAAFKQHAVFGFWKTSIMNDPHKIFGDHVNAMGSFGKIKSIEDLPADEVIIEYIQEAMRLNDEGIKVPAGPRKHEKPEIAEPDYFFEALSKNASAKATYEKFAPSHKREYLSWITEAKTEPTRIKRLEKAIEQMAEGKSQNWKYEKK
ncbi:MAG: YdeI/OmpD-associated family protein [Bacteroidia bacterium]